MRKTKNSSAGSDNGGELPAQQRRLAVAIIILVFLAVTAMWWTRLPPIGTDCDEHLIVARTFLRTGHFSVADVHGTKYPPLLSSIAILFQVLGLNVPLALVALNYLLILATALVLWRFLVKDGRIGLLSLLPVIYLLTNTVLWDSAKEIIADTILFFLTAVALLFALRVERWSVRATLLASLIAFLATMSRSIGLVVIVPLACSMIWDRRTRGQTPPYGGLALLAVPAVAALLLFMHYESRFGSHTTGYLETFLLNDPFDASKGRLTFASFLTRTLRGCLDSFRDLRDLTVYPSCAGAFSYALPLVLLGFACLPRPASASASAAGARFGLRDSDKRRILLLCSFALAYLAVSCLWPYKGARFVLPLLLLGAIGVNGALAWGMRRRAVAMVVVLLVIGHIAISAVNLHRDAVEKKAARAFLLAGFDAMTEWCRANIPQRDPIASFDYRELILRLDRPVIPLAYDSDTAVQIASLEREHARWLVVCFYIYPLRATYAHSIVAALGDRASKRFSNENCEVYELNLTASVPPGQLQREPGDGFSGVRPP
ncbi:MAG: hypothetical protein ACE149_16715 [Armatimonadota bacterium]